MASPPASISARSLAAVPGISILKYATSGTSRASRTRNGTDSVTPRQRRVLHHDRHARRLGDVREMLDDALLVARSAAP